MSDEDFLSRWSRRKREAAQSVSSTAQPATPAAPEVPSPADDASARPSNAGLAKPTDEFDLASLPSIESITATTNVAAFLRAGVPLELSRAALRRAWVSDPAIRDFIGPAENAWDFNDPNAMPGFGPLDQTPEQVRELAARIVNKVRDAAEEHAAAEDKPRAQDATESAPEQVVTQSPDPQFTAATPPVVEGNIGSVATDTSHEPAAPLQRSASHKEEPVRMVRRTHGGALPR